MEIEPRTADHPQGHWIEFHPGPHQYLLEGEPLVSVTTLVNRWFPKFDSEAVAKKKADREGTSYLALLAEWEKRRDEAASFGTKTHLMADRILQESDPDAADELAETDREKAYLAAVKAALLRIAPAYDVIESEKIVFSPERRVAGTIDLLLRSKTTGEFVIADWKTNKEIKYQGFGQEMGLGHCAHLPHCNFSHYSLQLAAYGQLLQSEGYLAPDVGVRGVLLHLNEKPGGQVTCEYIKTKDLSREANEILKAGLDD